MSLVTTVVVFVASMVLGECRQVTSAAQVGNDSIPLQVTPLHLLPLSCVHKECMTCLCLEPVDVLVYCSTPESDCRVGDGGGDGVCSCHFT